MSARGAAPGVVTNLAGAVLAGLAGLGVTWLVARSLGPPAAGAYFAATALFALAGTVAKLGTPTGLVYWPARLRARGEPHLVLPYVRAGLVPVAAASAALGLVLFLAAPLARGFAAELRALAVFLPCAVLTDALLSATRGLRRMGPTVVLDRLVRPASQAAGVALLAALVVGQPVLYALAWVAPYLPVCVLAALALRRELRPIVDSAGPAPRLSTVVGPFWAFTAPRALASVAQSALQRVDVLLVAALAGLGAAATYAVATRFLVVGQIVNQAVSQAVQPRLAELLAVGDRTGAAELYQVATGWLVLATWPLYLLVTALAPVYLVLFGPAYRDGTRAVVVLASVMLVATGCGMVDMVLAMAGRTSWNLGNVALALAVNVTANLALVPRFGVSGAACALGLAIGVNNLVPLAQVAHALRLHPFGAGTLSAAGLAIGCFGVLPLVVLATAGTGARALLSATGLGTLAYLAGAFRLRRVLRLDALFALRRKAPNPG